MKPLNITLAFTAFIITLSCQQEAPVKNELPEQGVATDGTVKLSTAQFKALGIKLGHPTDRNMTSYIEANGLLEVPPQNEAHITAVMGANIVSIEVIEGDKIDKNQVLAYLAHPGLLQLQSGYIDTWNKLQYQIKEHERQKELYENKVGSGRDFQKSETDLNSLKAQVKGYESTLRLLHLPVAHIRSGNVIERIPLQSPIEGFVQKVNVKTGQYVQPHTGLFQVVNTHHVHADLMVFEKDVHKVAEGQKVRFTIQSMPETELYASIYSVGKTFEQNPKAVHVHAEIKNKAGNLIPGMYIRGQILTDSVTTPAVPDGAIAPQGEKFYVYAARQINDQWRFIPYEVIPGVKNNGWTAIRFTDKKPESRLALNQAYYLLAENEKGSGQHAH